MATDVGETLRLETSCHVNATPARAFEAWTTPAELRKWWGPDGVRCIDAHVDLRVGGAYRIANELPDKSVLWIRGTFERVEHARCLVYSWRTSDDATYDERVSVHFESEHRGTRVTVVHERIATAALRDRHRDGWDGCLQGLNAYLG